MNRTLLSIIVPIYNSEEYLKECLDSILSQTLSDTEIILVDDGSLDESGRIADQYAQADPRIRVIHKPNEGLLKARLSGLLVADSDYVGFVDSDDYISDDYFERLYKTAVASDADMACASATFVFGSAEEQLRLGFDGYYDQARLKAEFYPRFVHKYKKNSIEVFPSFTPTKIYKRPLVLGAYRSIPDKLHIYEDVAATFYCVLKSCSIVCDSANCGYYYRQREDSMLHTFRADYGKDVLTLLHYMNEIACASEHCELVSESLRRYNTGRALLVFRALPYTNVKFSELVNDLRRIFLDPIALDASVLSDWKRDSDNHFEGLELAVLKGRHLGAAAFISALRRCYGYVRKVKGLVS